MHVGWRMKVEGTSPYLWLSLYYHEDYHYVSNLLDKIYFPYDATVWVDMYMNASTIGLIIGDKCIGVRGYGNPSNGSTFTKLRKTFWFDGNSVAPHQMELQFDNM